MGFSSRGGCLLQQCMRDEVRVPTSKAGHPLRIIQSPKHIAEAVKMGLVEWREVKIAYVLFPTFITAAPAELFLESCLKARILSHFKGLLSVRCQITPFPVNGV
jgi:hypothetical protein